MAPFFRRPLELQCPLCGQMIARHDADVVSLNGILWEEGHPLYDYKTAAMHRHCFAKWEHRRLCVRLFNEHQTATGGSSHMKQNGKVE